MECIFKNVNFLRNGRHLLPLSRPRTTENVNFLGKYAIKNSKDFHLTESVNKSRGKRAHWVAPTLIEMKKKIEILKEKGRYPLLNRPDYIEWNYEAELYAMGKRLNENFDENLLREALSEYCYINNEKERAKKIGLNTDIEVELKSNTELAKSGMALISDFSTKYLRTVCPKLPEDIISSYVKYLTSDEILSHIGKGIGLRDLILVKTYPPGDEAYARSFAAMVASINVSSGLERCQRFILDFVITQLIGKDLFDIWKVEDPFSVLRRILLNNERGEPEPRLLGDIGRKTMEAVFFIGIYDGNKNFLGQGYGESVGTALKAASYDSLSRLFEQTVSRPPLPFDNFNIATASKIEPNDSIDTWKMV